VTPPGTPAPTPPGVRPTPTITVRDLARAPGLGVELTLVAGSLGLDRLVRSTRIQKSGLALVGHYHGLVPTRVQLLGQTELSYLWGLEPSARLSAIRGLLGLHLSCVVITQDAQPTERDASGPGVLPVPELGVVADETSTPLLISSARSSVTIAALHAVLDDRLAPRVRLHGVLVDVFGVGLLLLGSSAIGKSECALDLVMRGHRLVADDVVDCDYRPPGMIFGQPADLLRHHLEVRGLGILNVKDLFGVAAIRERKRIDVVVKLVEWSRDIEYDRMGLDDRFHGILGVQVREIVIPVRPGRDMASILEVAARNELLKNAGHHAAREFFSALEGSLLSERAQDESGPPPPVAPRAQVSRAPLRPSESAVSLPALRLPSDPSGRRG
jgi:HPr kinase/phosphorylase